MESNSVSTKRVTSPAPTPDIALFAAQQISSFRANDIDTAYARYYLHTALSTAANDSAT